MTTLKERDAWMRALLISDEHETAKLIGVRLALYVNMTTNRCDPSYEGIARDVGGMSKDTATRHIKVLEQHGWISIARAVGRGRTNSFVLLPPPEKAAPRCGLFGGEKGRKSPPEKAASDDLKGRKSTDKKAAELCGPNRNKNRISEQRERTEPALAREPPSLDEGSASNFCEVKEDQIEILPPRKPAGQGKATPLPEDWRPDIDDRAFAIELGLSDGDIDDEAQRFRDYAAEKGKTSHNWSAFWRRFVGNSRLAERNTPEGRRNRRLQERVREAQLQEAAMRAAGKDPESVAARERAERARQEAEAEAERKAKGPPWSAVMQIIRRKVPSGEAFNRAERNFRFGSYRAGVLEITVQNAHLYPPANRETVAHHIRCAYAYLTDVRFNEGG